MHVYSFEYADGVGNKRQTVIQTKLIYVYTYAYITTYVWPLCIIKTAYGTYKSIDFLKKQSPNGVVYVGDWLDGVREGHGRLTWPDGSWYEGQFHKNCIQDI